MDTASVTRTVSPQPSSAACLECAVAQFVCLYLALVPAGLSEAQPPGAWSTHGACPATDLTENRGVIVVCRTCGGDTVAALCQEQQERMASSLSSWGAGRGHTWAPQCVGGGPGVKGHD